jgi:hypothetical protein
MARTGRRYQQSVTAKCLVVNEVGQAVQEKFATRAAFGQVVSRVNGAGSSPENENRRSTLGSAAVPLLALGQR